MTMPHPQAETRPKEVEISFWLWIATLVLGGLGAVITYFQIDEIRAQAVNETLADNPTLDPSVVENAATAGLVVGVVIGLLLIAAQVAFVFLMRGGRNWARIALAVLGGLGVLVGLLGLAGSSGALGAGSLLQLLLLIGAIVTMFLPAANAWFRPHRPEF